MPADVVAETLRERRRSLLWWVIGLVATIALTLAFYPSIRDDPSLGDYAEQLPESLRALFAGGELDLASPIGFLNSQIFAMVAPLLAIMFSVGAGAGAVAGEEERGTLDLLLAHPLTRWSFVVQRFVALVVLVGALTVVLLVAVALGARVVDLEIGLDRLAAASVSVGLLGLLFGALALAAGAIHPGRTLATAVAGGVAVAAWLLDGLGQAVSALEPWRPVSPFYQALGTSPLRDGPPLAGWAILAAASLGLAAIGAAGLERRDTRQ